MLCEVNLHGFMAELVDRPHPSQCAVPVCVFKEHGCPERKAAGGHEPSAGDGELAPGLRAKSVDESSGQSDADAGYDGVPWRRDEKIHHGCPKVKDNASDTDNPQVLSEGARRVNELLHVGG